MWRGSPQRGRSWPPQLRAYRFSVCSTRGRRITKYGSNYGAFRTNLFATSTLLFSKYVCRTPQKYSGGPLHTFVSTTTDGDLLYCAADLRPGKCPLDHCTSGALRETRNIVLQNAFLVPTDNKILRDATTTSGFLISVIKPKSSRFFYGSMVEAPGQRFILKIFVFEAEKIKLNGTLKLHQRGYAKALKYT